MLPSRMAMPVSVSAGSETEEDRFRFRIVGRLGAESADSESGRPLATRLWGGDTDPPTRLVDTVHCPDSGRLDPTQAGSGPTQGRDRLGPTQPPDPTLPSLLWRGVSPVSASFSIN
ncbi:hypothetical protein Taro_009613 [Colocasia esculenta]|uniref:Uncharacterized protein n=1 Tax=Colocasia esculenta TaxID=4460 RepID=A0A843TWT6_COLES|nr:hypothetical protein [Colocasia esculenta]